MRPMPEGKLSWRHLVYLAGLCGLALGLGLGSSTRLTYHEAFVAQGAREILSSGQWWYPAIGGLPWLEKPPLPFWLVAAVGWCMGTVSPLALPPIGTCRRSHGSGCCSPCYPPPRTGDRPSFRRIQATTAWTVLRGRLAEADMLLASLVVWTLLAFDRLRQPVSHSSASSDTQTKAKAWHAWRWAFFGLLSATTLVKGTGFGAALVLAVIALVLLWERDRVTRDRLRFPAGWLMVAVISLAWPLAMIAMHGFKVVELWALHITERVGSRAGHGPFAGESWSAYGLHVLAEALPWTPLALVGAWLSFGTVWRGHSRERPGSVMSSQVGDQLGGHRLFCSWALAPLILVSLASARNAHYAIYALVPWSIWAATALARLGCWQIAQGLVRCALRRWTWSIFGSLAAAYGISFWLAGPWFVRQGAEWAFYETAVYLLQLRRTSSCFTMTGTVTRIPRPSDQFPMT